LWKYVRELETDAAPAFPGHGQMKPEQLEIDRRREEAAKLKAGHDNLESAAAYFAWEEAFGLLSSRSATTSGR
jgi:transposase